MKPLSSILQGCILYLTLITVSCTQHIGDLPDFSIRYADSTEVNIPEFVAGKTALLINFDANCRSCQNEAEAIVSHLDELGDVRIVFMSFQDFDLIDLFDKHFKLTAHPNIIVGQDYSGALPNYVGVYNTPMLTLTDKNSHVRKVITGEIGMDELMGYINEIQ